MVLSYSRRLFCYPVLRMTQPEFLAAHVAAFDFFDGCPARLIPDNLGSGVLKADLYDPRLNRGYAELSYHYGCLVDPARVCHPKDKACASDCSLFEVSGAKSSYSCGALLPERLPGRPLAAVVGGLAAALAAPLLAAAQQRLRRDGLAAPLARLGQRLRPPVEALPFVVVDLRGDAPGERPALHR